MRARLIAVEDAAEQYATHKASLQAILDSHSALQTSALHDLQLFERRRSSMTHERSSQTSYKGPLYIHTRQRRRR